MKLPRDFSGSELAKSLAQLGYTVTRQTGSHMRLTDQSIPQHHITVPTHDPLKVGTLAAILGDVGNHLKLDRDELLRRLFG